MEVDAGEKKEQRMQSVHLLLYSGILYLYN